MKGKGSRGAFITWPGQFWPAFEMLEIIRLVEESHLPARQMLAKLGIPRTTF
jgi:hypothetical protein